MRFDPKLKKLAADFRAWRKRKQHVREPIPEDLMQRACRAARVHDVRSVAQATKLDQTRFGKLVKADADNLARRSKTRAAGANERKKLWPRPKKGRTGLQAGNVRGKAAAMPVPSYSRIELSAPSATARPVAEVETAAGVKLKVFEVTPGTVSLLSALTAAGRVP
jgi:hypothetical protein